MNQQPRLCQGQDNGADNINIRIPLWKWIQEENALANSHDFIQQQQLEAVGRDQQLRVKLKKQSFERQRLHLVLLSYYATQIMLLHPLLQHRKLITSNVLLLLITLSLM